MIQDGEFIPALERVGSRILEHFVAGDIDFNLCEGSLEIISDEQILFGIPESADPVPGHKVVCAWCNKLLCEGVEPVSHGICKECDANVRKEI